MYLVRLREMKGLENVVNVNTCSSSVELKNSNYIYLFIHVGIQNYDIQLSARHGAFIIKIIKKHNHQDALVCKF